MLGNECALGDLTKLAVFWHSQVLLSEVLVSHSFLATLVGRSGTGPVLHLHCDPFFCRVTPCSQSRRFLLAPAEGAQGVGLAGYRVGPAMGSGEVTLGTMKRCSPLLEGITSRIE